MGWYTWKFGDEEELRQMAAEGANVVLAVSATTDLDQGEEQFERHLASMLAYLDMAQRQGLRVIMQAAWYEAFREGDTAQIDRYPIWPNFPFMAQNGDRGPLMMAWSIAHGARTVQATGHLNPVPVMQGIGQQPSEDPTYF
jgi:hypothetical protein